MSDARSAIPGLAVVAQASGLDPTSLQDLLKATGKLLGFFGAGYLVYGSYGGAVPREYGGAWVGFWVSRVRPRVRRVRALSSLPPLLDESLPLSRPLPPSSS